MNDFVAFNLSQSTILVRLSEEGEKMLKSLDPAGCMKPNWDGYYHLFTKDFFTIVRYSSKDISTIVDGPICITSNYLKDEEEYQSKKR